jgi:hypothetical protein
MPMSPWEVAAGTYTRPDGTLIDLGGSDRFREDTQSVVTGTSVGAVEGDDESRDDTRNK